MYLLRILLKCTIFYFWLNLLYLFLIQLFDPIILFVVTRNQVAFLIFIKVLKSCVKECIFLLYVLHFDSTKKHSSRSRMIDLSSNYRGNLTKEDHWKITASTGIVRMKLLTLQTVKSELVYFGISLFSKLEQVCFVLP